MKIFVLGHRGMLGHVVARYFREQGATILTSETRFRGGVADPLVEEVAASDCAVVVNALGAVPQKQRSIEDLFRANSVFPLQLKHALRRDQQLIHVSTDCVFCGTAGNYCLESVPDAQDAYGLSKLLGEAVAEKDKATVVRSSIIGPDSNGPFGLMAWFLAQTGEVSGYTNHFWNGVTSLEWAKAVWRLLDEPHWEPVVHLATPERISKFELLRLVGTTFGSPVKIVAKAVEPVDRTLRPTIPCQPLEQQLQELVSWYYD